MSDNALSTRIKDVIENEQVVLFMKGTPQFVMCGNSGRALESLRAAGAPVTAVDILSDPSIRQELSVEDRTGSGDHFQVTVASSRFAGLPLLEQHRLVNEALSEPLRDGTIHELRIKTREATG